MLTATRPVDVQLVLVLSDPSTTAEFGRCIWLAAAEASELYDPGADEWLMIPVDGDREIAVKPRISRLYAGPAPLDAQASALDEHTLRSLIGELGTTFVDQRALVALVGDALTLGGSNLVVVTDRPIQPPTGFRYLIWDAVPGGVAVSVATLDPKYWREPADLGERQRAVKRRLRAALCSVFGTTVGLVRCDNPWCFLYADVDRVTRLDHFVRIGEEHRVPMLTGRGFREETSATSHEAVIRVAPPPP